MSILKCAVLALLAGLIPFAASAADAPAALTDAQKAAVEEVVRDLLTKKEPEILMQAFRTMQVKEEKAQFEKSSEAIKKSANDLFNNPDSPVGGNPKGDVTIVEFFDYSCGYCKMAQASVEKFIGEDKNVRLIYKEYPILGQASVDASKAALASVAQGKYVAFHNALMKAKDKLSMETILKLAKETGLDADKLKKDMEAEKIGKIIEANHEMAASMGVRGTPGFIIGNKLYPGALNEEGLKKIVAEVRADAAKK